MVLLLGQVDAMRQRGLQLLLQDLRVEHGDRYQVGVLDGVFDYLTRSLVEDNVGLSSVTPSAKRKCSYVEERIKITQQSKKQLKFKT
jgi:hypothetical protein